MKTARLKKISWSVCDPSVRSWFYPTLQTEIWRGQESSLWEHIDMAMKRTRADQAHRQADQLEKKSERRPEQGISKKTVRKDSGRAA